MDHIRQAKASRALSAMQEAQLTSQSAVPNLTNHPSGHFRPASEVKLDPRPSRVQAHHCARRFRSTFHRLRYAADAGASVHGCEGLADACRHLTNARAVERR